MKTVNSLSGGKTSSYLAVHFPADLEIFSLVCIDCHNAAGMLKKRPDLVQYANDKLERFIPYYGEFKATAEDPLIIQTMMDLEQKLGREIVWTRGVSFDTLIQKKNFLPNQEMRFCTSEMKMRPVFEHCLLHGYGKVEMRIGYRFDEQHRRKTATNEFKYPYMCNNYGQQQQRHKTIEWRECSFPLIDDTPTIHPMIQNYWRNNPDVVFPTDSNCQLCFWKDPQQKLRNYEKYPALMMWGAIQEEIIGGTMDKEISLLDNFKIGKQMDFFEGVGVGCTGGMCTD
jgi:hypothetical protein